MWHTFEEYPLVEASASSPHAEASRFCTISQIILSLVLVCNSLSRKLSGRMTRISVCNARKSSKKHPCQNNAENPL
ncbi:MAG: hypothetical protein JWQ38_3682 [Flavipsychrobacter sp.]|nr:hypothetical protein [Flavipsychrobacter sp.]